VGSFLRKDHPLFAQRLRQAARHGAQIHVIHGSEDDWLLPVARRITAAPSAWLQSLAAVAQVVAQAKGVSAPVSAEADAAATAIAESLLSGERKAVLLGNAAAQHPQAAALLSLANWIGAQVGAQVGYLTEAANTVGAQLVGAVPQGNGLNAAQMLGAQPAAPLKAVLLLNNDPVLDSANAAAAAKSLAAADMVVVLSPFKTGIEYADVILPTSPFTETSGSFVNAEGRLQSFVGVAKALGETRPGWKILRVLGNLLALDGFGQESSEQVRNEALGVDADLSSRLSNAGSATVQLQATAGGLERLAEVPIYAADALVRNSTSLQLTTDARQAAVARLPQALWDQLGLGEGASVRISQDGAGTVQLPAQLDAKLPANLVRVPVGLPETAALGAAFGSLNVSKV
jgi:NADH-quinone oxidoreductase subunit G